MFLNCTKILNVLEINQLHRFYIWIRALNNLSLEAPLNKPSTRARIIWGVFLCVVSMLFYFYEYMLRVGPNVMARELMIAYHLNAADYGNLFAFYFYFYAPVQIVVGVLFDRFGPRNLLMWSALVCAMGSYLFASTPFLWVAIFGRILLGLGTAFIFIGVLKIASILIPFRHFAFIVGCTLALGMLGAIFADFSLTYLVYHLGWKLTWYLLAMLGFLFAILMLLLMRDGNPYLSRLSERGHIVSWHELHRGLIKIIRSSQTWVIASIGFLMYMPLAGFSESWQIPYLVYIKHFTPYEAAYGVSMVFLGWAIGAPFVGWFSNVLGQRRLLLTLGASVAAVLLAYIIYVPQFNTSVNFFILFLFGFFSSAQGLVFTLTREVNPRRLVATSISFVNAILMLAGASSYLVGGLLEIMENGHILAGLHSYSASAFQVAFIIFPIGLVIVVFLTFFLKETYCKHK